MSDITMCQDYDCPNQYSCWRLLAPPDKYAQSYHDFKFNYELYEQGEYQCEFYIDMYQLNFKE